MAATDLTSTVDTSRPFRSVKEAVAVFGERLLVGEVYSSPKPAASVPMQEITTWMSLPIPTEVNEKEDDQLMLDTLKKLEAELEETKQELRLLKQREDDTEVALASLNAELHNNMSKLAQAEAAKASLAAKAVLSTTRISPFRNSEMKRIEQDSDSPTLADILSIGGGDSYKRGYFNSGGKKERTKMKKKPIIPLVGDLFSRKKGSPPYSSSHLFN